MFHGLPPVMSGFGMKMMKKMGWQEGQPLGKMGEGYLEPIAMDVKVDRSGELHSCLVCFLYHRASHRTSYGTSHKTSYRASHKTSYGTTHKTSYKASYKATYAWNKP